MDVLEEETPHVVKKKSFKCSPIAKANNEFGLKLLKEIAKNSNDNIFISPLSISIAFGMLYAGAMGSTAQELRNVLEYESTQLDNEIVHKEFQKLLNLIFSRDDKNNVIYFANKLIIRKGFKILESFENTLHNYYDVSIYSADYVNRGKEVVQYINKWDKTQTCDMIKEPFKDPLPEETALVVINTIYFKGKWKTPFDKTLTKNKTFYGYDNEFDKEFMMSTSAFYYIHSKKLKSKILELPYDGDGVSMIIVLPDERNGLKFLKDNLNLLSLELELRSMEETNVKIEIPKFKFSTSYEDFEKYLKALGMEEVFGDKSDLSGIAGSSLAISQLIHKIIIKVNKEGSEAEAVTGIIITKSSPQPKVKRFNADHPFVFFIRDNRNGLIVFAGQVIKFD